MKEKKEKSVRHTTFGVCDVAGTTQMRFHAYMKTVCKKASSPKVRFEILGKESTV
jgi:hypothetical protein